MTQNKEAKAAYNKAWREAHCEERQTYQHAWRKAHLEEQRIYQCAYWKAHPEKKQAYDRVYRESHLEKCRTKQRTYYKAHREEVLAAHRAYVDAHREEIANYNRSYARAWTIAHPDKRTESDLRRRAHKRGATVGPIDLEAIKARDRMRCCICGEKVDKRLKYPHPDSLSFDHSNPLELLGPHSQENLRVAHLRCNKRRGVGRLPVQMVLC